MLADVFVYVCLPSEAAWTVGVGRYLAQWAMDRAFIMVLTLIRYVSYVSLCDLWRPRIVFHSCWTIEAGAKCVSRYAGLFLFAHRCVSVK